jgi:outer membrane receptor protein involved in Fe transport
MHRFIILLFSLIISMNAWGQAPAASVVGRVVDPTGAVIPGVSVSVTNLDTNQPMKASTNEAGEYTVLYLKPGRYTMEAQLEGFRAHRQTEFRLEVDQILRLDVRLEIGAASDSITVSDTPPALNTESSARGEVTSGEEIKELPLDGRNFADLAYLTGGVIPRGDGGDGAYAVNGARADNFGFMLDGMNNTQRRNTGAMISPPIEGVQEFKLMTSGFSAEYGRYAGGVLSVVTKSGTNQLRGSLYEFLRNDMFDATGYFDPEKSKLRRNQFGTSVSGPVYLPKLYDGRNKTFFMFTWDSLRVVDGKTQRGIVPWPEMLKGDFSRATDAFGKKIAIRDTLAAAPFPNNQIPFNRLDPVSLKMAAYFPAPNLTGSSNNFISQGNSTTDNNSYGVKIDHLITSNDRVTVSTFWRPNSGFDPIVSGRSPLPVFGLTNDTLDLLPYIRYTRSITPTMFLETNVSFSRKTNNQVWPLSAQKDWATEIGFLGATNNPIARGLPQFEATGYVLLGPAYDVPKIWSYNNYQYAASLTWIKGKHNMKFGGDFLRTQYFSRNWGDTRGRLTFNGRFTSETMADMLLGWPSSSRRQLDASGPYHLLSSYSGFFQDDFKVTPTLTLNIGVRYELMKPPLEKFGAWAMFVPELGKVVIAGRGNLSQEEYDRRIKIVGANQVTTAAAAGLPQTITNTDYNNLGPRLGFAWRPFGDSRTVLRGGYGIFYGTSSLYRMDEYSDTYPFSITETFSVSGTNPTLVTASNPFPTNRANAPSGVTSTAGQESVTPKTQYLQTYNLTVEREFWSGTVLEASYSGSKGTHLQRRYDMNQPYREQALRQARPVPGFGTINIISDSSNSIYNSGSLTVRRRLSGQFFVRAAYTYAKSLDESSNTGGTVQYNFPNAQDSRDLRAERGRSDFDIGHSFAASFIWSPKFSRQMLLKDWQLSGTSTIYTGPPFTPRLGTFDYTNGGASRPDRIGSGKLDPPTIDQWFDRTAFPAVPLGAFRFGTAGRNILDGPGTININTSVSRRVKFQENKALQFRLEIFNLPNHPNFNLPENRVDFISGGTISRVKSNRSMQLGARLEF